MLGLILGLSGCTRVGAIATDADRLAAQVVDAVGGKRAAERLAFLRYDWTTETGGKAGAARSYVVDQKGGRVYLDAPMAGGVMLALFNEKTGEGAVYQNGSPAPAAFQRELLEQARTWHRADAWRLLAATRLTDPALNREYAGMMAAGEKEYPTLHVWADAGSNAFPPGHYWLHIDPATRWPAGWTVAAGPDAAKGRLYLWTRWTEVEGVAMPVRIEEAGGSAVYSATNVIAPRNVNDSVFNAPMAGANGKVTAPADVVESVIELNREAHGGAM